MFEEKSIAKTQPRFSFFNLYFTFSDNLSNRFKPMFIINIKRVNDQKLLSYEDKTNHSNYDSCIF